jgi:uncharacterized protein (DUF2141 family)
MMLSVIAKSKNVFRSRNSSLAFIARTRYRMILKCSKLALAMTVGFVGAPLIARSQPALQPDEIRIVVSGVRNQKGSVICSLLARANSDEFTKTGTQTRKLSVPIHDSQAVCEFEALPAGAYAATVFHDENGDGKFNRRFGYPLEGYGFTNNVRPMVEAPSFDECKIEYAGKGILTVSIDIIYR